MIITLYIFRWKSACLEHNIPGHIHTSALKSGAHVWELAVVRSFRSGICCFPEAVGELSSGQNFTLDFPSRTWGASSSASNLSVSVCEALVLIIIHRGRPGLRIREPTKKLSTWWVSFLSEQKIWRTYRYICSLAPRWDHFCRITFFCSLIVAKM